MGFQALEPYLAFDVRRVQVGTGVIQAMPLHRLLNVALGLIRKDPLALLCDRMDCERCNAVRASLPA
jgi:hypothetical protein